MYITKLIEQLLHKFAIGYSFVQVYKPPLLTICKYVAGH